MNQAIKPQFDMTQIATDIMAIKFKKTDTIDACWKKFFAVMKKHGVCHGTPIFREENDEYCGSQSANFEWTMCETLFTEHMKHTVAFWYDFGVNGCKIPKAIESYKYKDVCDYKKGVHCTHPRKADVCGGVDCKDTDCCDCLITSNSCPNKPSKKKRRTHVQ